MSKKTVGIVEVKARDPKKLGSLTFRAYTDKEGNVVTLKDASGNPRVHKMTKPVITLDLSKPKDLALFEFLDGNPTYVEPSPSNWSNPPLILVHITEEAVKHVDKARKSLEAVKIALDLNGDALKDFARLLGLSSDSTNEAILSKAVVEIAQNDPGRIVTAWTDKDRGLSELLQKAKARGVIKVTKGIWKYKQNTMGADFESALLWLKDEENESLQPLIRKEVENL